MQTYPCVKTGETQDLTPMRRATTAILVLATAGGAQVPLGLSSSAQNSQRLCQVAISDVARAIATQGAHIGVMEFRPVQYPVFPATPYPGSQSLVFGLGRSLEERSMPSVPREVRAASDILSSPKLAMNWAKQIISTCPNISHVAFNQRYSGWSLRVFRFPNGEVREPFCVDTSIRNPPWGSDCCCT